MSAMRHIDPDDLALLAMQFLSLEDANALKVHLDRCIDCRREFAAVQGDLAVYAHTVDMHSPPAQARERLMKQVAREKRVVPIDRSVQPEFSGRGTPGRATSIYGGGAGTGSFLDEEEQPKRRAAGGILPWLGWAAAAGLAVTAGSFYHQRSVLRDALAQQSDQVSRLSLDVANAHQLMDTLTDPTAIRVTLTKPQTAKVPQGRATYVPEKGSLIFLASNLEPLQPNKTYELWIIPADGKNPVPAGTFRPDQRGDASVIMPILPKGVDAKAFGVTIEDDGGSQTPTMPIIIAGN